MVNFRLTCTLVVASGLLVSSSEAFSSIASNAPPTTSTQYPDIREAVQDFFSVVGTARDAKVFEAPVRQDGVKLYIATDGDFDHSRPGNGGIRLLDYHSENDAIDDAIRLAEGMFLTNNTNYCTIQYSGGYPPPYVICSNRILSFFDSFVCSFVRSFFFAKKV